MRKLYAWLNQRLLKNRSLYGKLTLIFCFFFFLPVAGLIYFGVYYDLLADRYLPLFFAALLGFSFFGLNLLRKLFDDITSFSKEMSIQVQSVCPDEQPVSPDGDELQRLVSAFGTIDRHRDQSAQALKMKSQQIAILKELADQAYVTADTEEILYIMLERALSMSDSDIGSIMLLEQPERKRFKVVTAIGLKQWGEAGTFIDFENSIAKYAVLNKAAMVVDDVEKDSRFGRANRPQYGTKSFICLPIKTSREIIGVVNISRTNDDAPYNPGIVAVLEPLASLAAFTFENLSLRDDHRRKDSYLSTICGMLDHVQSSFRGHEMLRAVMNEMRNVIAFEAAFILCRDSVRSDALVVHELIASAPTLMAEGDHFVVLEGSMLHQVIRKSPGATVTDTDYLAELHHMDIMGDQESHPVLLTAIHVERSQNAVLGMVLKSGTDTTKSIDFVPWAARCLESALERNRLYDAVVKRNRELDSIRQLGGALASSTFDIQQVIEYTMEMIQMIIRVEAGMLYLVKDNELVYAASFNTPAVRPAQRRLKMGQGIPGHVAARGEPLAVNEGRTSILFSPEIDHGDDFEVKSVLCVPMVSQGKVIGVIEVVNKTGGDFVPDDEDLLQSIASSVSIAVENANLYKETVSMAEKERGIRNMFQKFVPKEVLERILVGSDVKAALTEELKTLTFLNIDLRGFSIMSKSLGPQKSVSLLNAFFSLMGGIVFKHHGIVDKYLGDGLLAIFGAPVSRPDDADNALNAALEMLSSLDQINNGLAATLGVTLKIGISVHTGEAVVGNIGFEMKMDYTVIGDSVNDVFRLQDMVRPFPNSIFFTDKTLRDVRMKLSYIELDDKLGSSAVYELLGKSH